MYKVKGIQCHSNYSLQQLELKKKKKATKTSSIIYVWYKHNWTYLHKVSFVVTLVDKEFSSKYSLVGLITDRLRVMIAKPDDSPRSLIENTGTVNALPNLRN